MQESEAEPEVAEHSSLQDTSSNAGCGSDKSTSSTRRVKHVRVKRSAEFSDLSDSAQDTPEQKLREYEDLKLSVVEKVDSYLNITIESCRARDGDTDIQGRVPETGKLPRGACTVVYDRKSWLACPGPYSVDSGTDGVGLNE